jgi:hypothetical protein
MKQKIEQVEFILDLLELKSQNLKGQQLDIQSDLYIRHNSFFVLLESLIAHFLDKYQIPFEIIKDEWEKRNNFRNNK